MNFKWINPFRRRTISVSQVHEWEQETQYTPDVAILEMHKFLPLLECGNAMREQGLYSVINEHSFYRGRAYTKEHLFEMRKHEDEALIFTQSRRKSGKRVGRVQGELHMVEPEGFLKLDKARQNGVKFIRINVKVDLPYKERMMVTNQNTGIYRKFDTGFQHDVKNAFIYVANPDFWEPQLDGGFAFPYCPRIEPEKGRPYYTFKK